MAKKSNEKLLSQEEKLKLIQIVEKRPMIWDKTKNANNNFTSRSDRKRIWDEIAAEFGRKYEVKFLQAKWVGLKKTFNEKYAKQYVPLLPSFGAEAKDAAHPIVDQIKWVFFKDLMFLKESTQSALLRTNLSGHDKETSDNYDCDDFSEFQSPFYNNNQMCQFDFDLDLHTKSFGAMKSFVEESQSTSSQSISNLSPTGSKWSSRSKAVMHANRKRTSQDLHQEQLEILNIKRNILTETLVPSSEFKPMSDNAKWLLGLEEHLNNLHDYRGQIQLAFMQVIVQFEKQMKRDKAQAQVQIQAQALFQAQSQAPVLTQNNYYQYNNSQNGSILHQLQPAQSAQPAQN